MMTEEDMRALIKDAKRRAGTWKQLAEDYGVSEAYLHAVVGGQRAVTGEMAKRLGYEKVKRLEFVPLEESCEGSG